MSSPDHHDHKIQSVLLPLGRSVVQESGMYLLTQLRGRIEADVEEKGLDLVIDTCTFITQLCCFPSDVKCFLCCGWRGLQPTLSARLAHLVQHGGGTDGFVGATQQRWPTGHPCRRVRDARSVAKQAKKKVAFDL
jgi:hypothetical protein